MKKRQLPDFEELKKRFTSKYEAPWASYSESAIVTTGSWRYERPVMDMSQCNQCGICYVFCPQGCIEDKGDIFVSNLDFCKGCGICARVCPKKAIIMLMEE